MVLCRILSKVPLILLLCIVFSPTFISGSVFNFCVSSRKLNNPYCLSVGIEPANYSISLQLSKNAIPVIETSTQQSLSTSTKLLLNETSKSLISFLNVDSTQQHQQAPTTDSAAAEHRTSQICAA